MKLLIDECLSVALAEMATVAGHPESAHVTRRDMKGWKDHQLMKAIWRDRRSIPAPGFCNTDKTLAVPIRQGLGFPAPIEGFDKSIVGAVEI